jgi:hypothetical protein
MSVPNIIEQQCQIAEKAYDEEAGVNGKQSTK